MKVNFRFTAKEQRRLALNGMYIAKRLARRRARCAHKLPNNESHLDFAKKFQQCKM